MSSTALVLFGCGGHGRSVADIVLANGLYSKIVFVDPAARDKEEIFGFPVVNCYDYTANPYLFTIGDNEGRRRKFFDVGVRGLVSIVSGKSHIGFNVRYGAGCFIGNYCHLGPDASIGVNTILNNSSTIEHEVIIGDHCHVGPGAAISGRCRIGDLVFIGVGATIRDYVQVCSQVTVGAGATVVKDITEPGVYVGTPARKIK